MPSLRKLHVANSGGRDATVDIQGLKPGRPPRKGLPGVAISFRRFISSAPGTTNADLEAVHGPAFGQVLIDGDPDADMEIVGRTVGPTDRVFLSNGAEVMYAPPRVIELILNPDGSERERRDPVDEMANINDESPVRWTGRKIPLGEAVRRFAFQRTLQVRHVDGLTYDFLFAMAKELVEEGAMVRLGAGPKGRGPLIMQFNGSRYQAFLEGRVDGESYMLLLHLSNLELRPPAPSES